TRKYCYSKAGRISSPGIHTIPICRASSPNAWDVPLPAYNNSTRASRLCPNSVSRGNISDIPVLEPKPDGPVVLRSTPSSQHCIAGKERIAQAAAFLSARDLGNTRSHADINHDE